MLILISDGASTQSVVVLILTYGETRYDERRAEETRQHVEKELEGEVINEQWPNRYYNP